MPHRDDPLVTGYMHQPGDASEENTRTADAVDGMV